MYILRCITIIIIIIFIIIIIIIIKYYSHDFWGNTFSLVKPTDSKFFSVQESSSLSSTFSSSSLFSPPISSFPPSCLSLSNRSTTSQWSVWGNKSIGIALTGRNGNPLIRWERSLHKLKEREFVWLLFLSLTLLCCALFYQDHRIRKWDF